MSHTVGAVALLAGLTVRTLHHYDEIGLLSPSDRSASGYRQYAEADVERLQRVLFYRELGFGLEQIKTLMNDRSVNAVVHLRRQHELLLERIGRLQRMASAVTREMEAHSMGINLTPEERLEVFGEFNPDDHAAEVEERWGKTDAYRESTRRASGYTKADWQRIKDEGAEITDRLVAAMRSGAGAESADAMDAAEAHRQQISRWFYDCPIQMHVGLGEMYIADPRFTATYEKVAPGLAQFIHDAIKANAARQAAPG